MRSNGLWCQRAKNLGIVAIDGRVFKFTMGSSFLRYTGPKDTWHDSPSRIAQHSDSESRATLCHKKRRL